MIGLKLFVLLRDWFVAFCYRDLLTGFGKAFLPKVRQLFGNQEGKFQRL